MLSTHPTDTLEKVQLTAFPQHHLYYLPSLEAIMMVPLGRVSHSEFKAVHMELLQLYTQYHPTCFIVDERQLTHIDSHSRRWMVTNFMRLPAVKTIGRNHTSIVIIRPHSPLIAALTRAMHKVISSFTPFTLHYAPTEEEAFTIAERGTY